MIFQILQKSTNKQIYYKLQNELKFPSLKKSSLPLDFFKHYAKSINKVCEEGGSEFKKKL